MKINKSVEVTSFNIKVHTKLIRFLENEILTCFKGSKRPFRKKPAIAKIVPFITVHYVYVHVWKYAALLMYHVILPARNWTLWRVLKNKQANILENNIFVFYVDH